MFAKIIAKLLAENLGDFKRLKFFALFRYVIKIRGHKMIKNFVAIIEPLLEEVKFAHKVIHVAQTANRPVHPLVNVFGHLALAEGN